MRFDILRLPTSTDSQRLADRYEAEQARALQEGNSEEAEQWGARADMVRYSGAHVEGKVKNYRDS